jgi:hypothetical protein
MELQQRIADRIGEFLIFAVTPPRLTTEPEQTRQIAEITLARLRSVGIDGLVLYDIDDESDRNPNERPFPFLPTMDPAEYLARDLVGLDVPAIVYRAVSKHAEDGPDLPARGSRDPRAARARGQRAPPAHRKTGCRLLLLRHPGRLRRQRCGGSGLRLSLRVRRPEPGAGTDRLHILSLRLNKDIGVPPVLGVDVPRWIANDLRHADDTLDASYHRAFATANELIAFCRRIGVPFGLNIESVSIRKVEIEASVRLAAQLGAQLRR